MKLPISEKSAFAPIRYQATRSWWKDLGKLASKVAMADFSGRSRLIPELHKQTIQAMQEKIGVRDPRVAQNESTNIQSFGAFLAYGRVIYEISETLTDNLAVTDFDDATLSDLSLPKGEIYLHFGDHPVLMRGKVQYEGAYVRWLDKEQLLAVSAVPCGAFASKPYRFTPADSTESFPVFFTSPNETLKSAISATRSKLEENRRQGLAQIEAIRQQFGGSVDLSGALSGIGDMPDEETYRCITSLVLAVLCFLEARPDDVLEGYPADTPPLLLESLTNNSNRGKQTTAQRQAEKDGYVKIKYVGNVFEQSKEAVRLFQRGQSPGDVTRTVATHPRRGFFRRQPCGPGRVDRKIKFIAPTIVNPGGKIGPGHVFTVE